MRVLLGAWGSIGDHAPVAALAGRLAEAGHAVHVLAAVPFRPIFGSRIADFTAIRLKPDVPPERSSFARRAHTTSLWRDQIDPLVEDHFATAQRALDAHRFDLALAAHTVPAIASAAQACGVPFAPLLLDPFQLLDPEDLPVFVDWPRVTACAAAGPGGAAVAAAIRRKVRRNLPALVALRERLGLADDDGLLPGLAGRGLLLFPEALLRSPGRHIPVNREAAAPAHPPPEIRRFLDAGAPPWLISFGSFLGPPAARLIADLTRLLREAGERVIVSWGMTEAPSRHVDGAVMHVRSQRPANIYAHVKGVIHHGGINMSLETLAAGRPSLVMPQIYDQLDTGLRISRLGAGICVPPQHQARPERLAAAVNELVSDQTLAERAAAAVPLLHTGLAPGDAIRTLMDLRAAPGH